jgi:hypothetical protein
MLYRHYYLTRNVTGTQMVPTEFGSLPNCNSWDGRRVEGTAPHNYSIRKIKSVDRRDGHGSLMIGPRDLNHRQHTAKKNRGGVRELRKLWDTDPE